MRTVLGLSVWSLAGTAVLAIYSLILVGYILHLVGPERFAPWAAAAALVGYLALLDTGLSSTTTRDASQAAAGNAESVRRVQAAGALFAGLAVFASAVGILGSFLIPVVLGLSGPPAGTATLVALILVGDFTIVLATAGWIAVLRGLQRYDLIFVGYLVHAVVGTILTLALTGPFGMPGAALAQVGGRIASRSVFGFLVARQAPWFDLLPRPVERSRIRALWSFSLPIFGLQLATQIGVGTDVVVVGLTAGAVAVGLYAAGSQLARNVSLFIGPILSVMLPVLSRAAADPGARASRQLPTFVVMGGIVGGAVFGGLILEAVPIVDLWTGRQPQLTIDVLRIYAAAFILVTPVQLLVIALIAAGRHGLIGAIVLGNSVVNLCLSAILAVLIGPVGVAIGTLVVVSFDNGIVIPYVAARRLGFSHRTIYGAVSLGIGIGLLIVGSSQLIPVDGVAGLAVRVAWCGLLTAVALALAWKGQVLGRSLEASAAGRA